MITLEQNAVNEFVIYADTIPNDAQSFGDYFLIGFQSGFTKYWSYVIPFVLKRNSRFLKFQISVVPSLPEEDPANGSLYLSPSGNWDYKIWNLEEPGLDPSAGYLIDEGQMIMLNQTPPEIQFTTYYSANDNLKSVVYYTANGGWNNTAQLWNYYESDWQKA